MNSTPDEDRDRGVFEVGGDEVGISIDREAFFHEIDRLEKLEIQNRPRRIANAVKSGRNPDKIPAPQMIARFQAVARLEREIVAANNYRPYDSRLTTFLHRVAKEKLLT